MGRTGRGPLAHRDAHQPGDCRQVWVDDPGGWRRDRGDRARAGQVLGEAIARSGTTLRGKGRGSVKGSPRGEAPRIMIKEWTIAEPARTKHGTVAGLSPWWAGWRLSVVLLVAVLAAGTAGYVIIEGWDVFDAFYMTITTVTTVGYGEIHPLSRPGRVFNIAVVILGVATVLYTFSFLMARLVEGDLQARWARRRLQRMLNDLTNHFIICGFGRIGQIVAREFSRQEVPFVIIERDVERMQAAIDIGYLA